MTTTERQPLTDLSLMLVQSSAELHALADCLRAEADADGDTDGLRVELAKALRRISKRLWEAA